MITIILPWPEPALWPNRKAHWRVKSQCARAARDEGYVAALAALGGHPWRDPGGVITLTVWGHKPAEHGQDRDGFTSALKHYFDGMASALNVNDRRFKPVVDWGANSPPHGRVYVEIAE